MEFIVLTSIFLLGSLIRWSTLFSRNKRKAEVVAYLVLIIQGVLMGFFAKKWQSGWIAVFAILLILDYVFYIKIKAKTDSPDLLSGDRYKR